MKTQGSAKIPLRKGLWLWAVKNLQLQTCGKTCYKKGLNF